MALSDSTGIQGETVCLRPHVYREKIFVYALMYTGRGRVDLTPVWGKETHLSPFNTYIVIHLESNGDTFGYVLHMVG